VLAVYGYAAIDEVDELVGILGDDAKNLGPVRSATVFVLRHWLSADAGNYKRLHDAKASSGVLRSRGYKAGEAETIQTLLFDFPQKDWFTVETFDSLAKYLAHRRTAIAELAFWHLTRLSLNVKLPAGFNAGLGQEERQKYSTLIEDMITNRRLPPMPPEKGPS